MPAKPIRKSARKSPAATAKKPAGRKAAKPRKSRVFTISLPPDLAARAEAFAQEDSRTVSELFREALRSYESARILKALREAAEYGSTRNPHGYTEKDIPRIIREVRAGMRSESERKLRKAG
jgi:Ribbon-helix-helix protein, copG family